MEEIQMLAALVALAKAHPCIATVLGLWLALSVGWKAQAKERRDEWTKLYPRAIGVLRFALELLPDLLGAARVLLWQVVRGMPGREPQLTVSPDSPIKGVLVDDAPLAGTGAGERETIAPDPSAPRSSGGFAEHWVLTVIAGVVMLALGIALLTGCPLPAPDNCTPFATRCSPGGIPETCSQSQRWSHAPPASPCSSRGPVVCCRTRSPWGRELYACAPQSACLPETAADAGAEVSDAR